MVQKRYKTNLGIHLKLKRKLKNKYNGEYSNTEILFKVKVSIQQNNWIEKNLLSQRTANQKNLVFLQ